MSAEAERLERLLNLMRGRVRNRTPGQMPLWSREVGYLVNEIDRLRTLEAETLRLARIGADVVGSVELEMEDDAPHVGVGGGEDMFVLAVDLRDYLLGRGEED